MKRFLLAIALLFISSPAWAQCSGVFPTGTYCGNNSGSTNVPTALPLPTINNIPLANDQILIGGVDVIAHGQTMSGDCTITNAGVTTCTKLQNVGVTTTGASTNDVMYYNGTGWLHNALLTIFNAACVASPSTCTTVFGYANPVWWGAATAASGATNSSAFASAIAASKYVFLPAGTYIIASATQLQPNTRFSCAAGTTITQANNANLVVFFDLFTNTPNGAQVDHCIIDGNSANNTINANNTLLTVIASNVNIIWNTFQNATGGAISMGSGTNNYVEHNAITSAPYGGISDFTNVSTTGNHQIRFNKLTGPMSNMILVQNVNGNDISFNDLEQGLCVGGAASAMQVTTAAGTITWVSGTNFSGTKIGEILVTAGGDEFPITAVNSTTQLTSSNVNNHTNQPACIGGGDIMEMVSTSDNRIIGNKVYGGATGGIVWSNIGAVASTKNLIAVNEVKLSGNFGIALEAATGQPINQTSIVGNFIDSPGRSGAAGAAPAAIQLSAGVGLMVGVLIDGNYAVDDFTVAGGFWLTGSGSANATYVNIGTNTNQGFAGGTGMNNYLTFANIPAIKGAVAQINDGLAANCGDGSCTTWNTSVLGGGGALTLGVMYNGTNWRLISK